MTTKIKLEIWDAGMKKCESTNSFDAVDAFLAEAEKLKGRTDSAILKVHIPGSILLSNADRAKIDSLGIVLF